MKQRSEPYSIIGGLACHVAHVVQFATTAKLTLDCIVEGDPFGLSVAVSANNAGVNVPSSIGVG